MLSLEIMLETLSELIVEFPTISVELSANTVQSKFALLNN